MKNPYQKYYSVGYRSGTVNTNQIIELQDLKRIFSDLSLTPKNTVLDVACGVSTLGKIFGKIVYGFDLNPHAVKIAKKHGIHAVLWNVEKKWPYKNESFDVVVASHIIEHVIYPDRFLIETRRVLKPHGLLVILTPNLAAWFNRILLLFGYQPFFTEVSTVDKTLGLTFTRNFTSNRNPVGHLRLFTPNALLDILKLYNFKIIKSTGKQFGSFSPLLQKIDKMISTVTPLASTLIVVGEKL